MPHFLVVEDLGEGEFERWIQHENECVNLVQKQWGTQWPCKIGGYVSWSGFEDLSEEPEYNTPGKHEITLYEDYRDSYFEDSEVYLEIVRK